MQRLFLIDKLNGKRQSPVFKLVIRRNLLVEPLLTMGQGMQEQQHYSSQELSPTPNCCPSLPLPSPWSYFEVCLGHYFGSRENLRSCHQSLQFSTWRYCMNAKIPLHVCIHGTLWRGLCLSPASLVLPVTGSLIKISLPELDVNN